MTTAQVVETSVTVNNNSPIQDYVHPDDQTQPTFKIIIISKPRISVQDIYHTHYFLQREKLVLRSLLSEGRYFRGNSYFRDLLTPVIFYGA